MDYVEVLFKAYYEFENVPVIFRKSIKKTFMKRRNLAAKIYNEYVDAVNKQWTKSGKPFAFGDHLEDINPEYALYIQSCIQPVIDKKLTNGGCFWKCLSMSTETYADE